MTQKLEDDELNIPAPPPVGQPSRFNLGNDVKKTVAISFVVAIVVFVGMGMFGGGAFVTKSDFEANMSGITASVDQAKADMEKITGDANAAIAKANADIAAAVQSVPATISTQVSNQINTSLGQINNQLNVLSSKLDTMSNAVDQTATNMYNANKAIEELQAQVVTLEEDIQDLQERVDELENAGGGSTSNDAGVTVKVTKMSSLLIPTSVTKLKGQFKVELANTTNQDIDDLILDVYIETGVTYDGMVDFTLEGGTTLWEGYGWGGAQSYNFVNSQWGLNLDANKTKTLYLTMEIIGGTGANFTQAVPYNVDVTVE